MVPECTGKVKSISSGDYKVEDTVCVLETAKGDMPLSLMQKWPVRRARPYSKKLPPSEPMISGQRVVDALFPIAKGGTACIPGPFGSGKTVTQHQLAKWSDVDIVFMSAAATRQRNDGRFERISRIERPEIRLFADEAHGADREYLRYAGRGA